MTRSRDFDVTFPLTDYLPEAPAPARSVPEPARDVPVIADCDVAVLGGGPAGVCAAAAAARAGRRVVLVERCGCLGGMATIAGVNVWHKLLGADDATAVIGGLVAEAVERLRALDAVEETHLHHFIFCSETAKFVFDDLAVGSGVRLLLHTLLAGAVRAGDRVVAAIVEGKSGRGAIVAETFIDATGDADLVRRAGGETQLGDAGGRCQPPGLCCRARGRTDGAMPLNRVQAQLFREPMDYNGRRYPTFLWGNPSVRDKAEHMVCGTRILGVNVADTRDLTRAEVEGRYQLRWVLGKLREQPGWEAATLVDVAAQVGTRESHRILADHQLTRAEVLEGRRFDDAVAQGTYPIDIHNPDGPGILFERLDGTWTRVAGDGAVTKGRWDGAADGAPARDTLCYGIPYRCLVPRGLSNVLAAGRCAGAEHDAAGAVRVMVNCMQLGQAAGTAAAMLPPAANVRDVDAGQLRARLIADGAPLLP